MSKIPVRSRGTVSCIRQIDPGRDMPAVLDLVELGFRDELDPQGWKMLHQMRRLYHSEPVSRVISSAGLETSGFVWVEAGNIVGNLSLRRALVRQGRGRLIGNVVVHPDYRDRGIGRSLMEKAIERARQERADWIGLEVRQDNVVADHLYQQLGFRPVGCTEHLIRPADLRWPSYRPPSRDWRPSRPKDADRWKALATRIYNAEQQLVLEIRTSQYAYGGLSRRLKDWLRGKREWAWVYPSNQAEIHLAARREMDRRFRFYVWDMLMRPDLGEAGGDELSVRLLAGGRRLPSWPVVAVIQDDPVLKQTLQALGFRPHRRLQQMILSF